MPDTPPETPPVTTATEQAPPSKIADRFDTPEAFVPAFKSLYKTVHGADLPEDKPLFGEGGRYTSIEHAVEDYKNLQRVQTRLNRPAGKPSDGLAIEPETRTTTAALPSDPEEALTKIGLSGQELFGRWQEKGSLTDSQYEKLSKAGFARPFVDDYMRGQQARQELRGMVESTAKQQAVAMVGGEAQHDTIRSWAASGGIDQNQLRTFNRMVQEDPSTYPMIFRTIAAAYEAANGKGEPAIHSGSSRGSPITPPKEGEITDLVKRAANGDQNAMERLRLLK